MRRFLWFHPAPRAAHGTVVGILCALLVAGIAGLGWLQGLERGALDALFHIRGTRLPAPEITILEVDDATVAQVGKWPLPRRVYADVVRRVTRAGAKTIGFDVLFADQSTLADDDELIRACRESGRVVQAVAFQAEGGYNPTLPVSTLADRRGLPARFRIEDQQLDGRSAVWVSATLPELRDSAVALGNVSVYPEMDGALRRIPHLILYRTATYPSLALAAAAHFLDVKPPAIVAAHNEVRVANRRVPVDANGETWINWVGANRSFPTYSIKTLFEGRVPPQALKNRIVLIGITAAGAFEYRATPFSAVQPAIELQANGLDNILLDRPLREISAAAQWWLLIGFAVLVGIVIAPRRGLGGTLWIIGLSGVLWLMAALALDKGNSYVPPVAPLLAGALTYAVMTAANYRQEWIANWRADAAVSAIARGGALMASERDRKRLRGEICQTAREALHAREVFLLTRDTVPFDALGRTLEQVTRSVGSGQALFWPAAGQEHPSLNPTLVELLGKLSHEVQSRHPQVWIAGRSAFRTLVVAPLPRSKESPVSSLDDSADFNGALIAVGRDNGRAFTARDATLLQTLAEQATLALDNLEYYERLRGRVEAADRELRSAYEMLAEQSAKLVTAVESIDDALIVSDEDGRAIFINNAASTILWDAVPILAQSVPDQLRAHGLEEIAVLYDEIQSLQESAGSHEAAPRVRREITLASGNSNGHALARRMLTAQLTPLTSDEGRLLGAMLVVADVTAQRDLEQMKTDFMSFVAHELRSPLGTILGYASLLHQGGSQFPAQQRAEMNSTIINQCRRLNRMIGEMLDLGRLEAGHKLELRREAVDLNSICRQALDGQRASLHDIDAYTFHLESDRQPLTINADPDRVEQIVINLLSNAVKYSPDGGTVSVKLREENGSAILSVSDTGMGMTPEQVAQLFQKFYRAPEAQARRIKGTGLGLYLVKQLVDAHGGHIEVESQSGRGTTFTVTFPKEASVQQAVLNGAG